MSLLGAWKSKKLDAQLYTYCGLSQLSAPLLVSVVRSLACLSCPLPCFSVIVSETPLARFKAELCESPGHPVPNKPYGFCGRKATLKLARISGRAIARARAHTHTHT